MVDTHLENESQERESAKAQDDELASDKKEKDVTNQTTMPETDSDFEDLAHEPDVVKEEQLSSETPVVDFSHTAASEEDTILEGSLEGLANSEPMSVDSNIIQVEESFDSEDVLSEDEVEREETFLDGKKSLKEKGKAQSKHDKVPFWNRLFRKKTKPGKTTQGTTPQVSKDGEGQLEFKQVQVDEKESLHTLTVEEISDLIRSEINANQDQYEKLIRSTLEDPLKKIKTDAYNAAYRDLVAKQVEGLLKKFDDLQEEIRVVHTEVIRVLENSDLPVKERINQVGDLREYIQKVEKEVDELDEYSRMMAVGAVDLEADNSKNKLDTFRSELDLYKARLESQPKSPSKVSRGMATWQFILIILAIAASGLAGIYLPTVSKSDNSVRVMVDTAALYQASGSPDDAIRVLDDVVQQGVQDVDTLGRIGEMYRVLKEYNKAITVLNSAVAIDPNNVDFLLSLARTYGNSGMHQEAIAQYQNLIMLDNKNYTYYMELGHRYRSLQEYPNALSSYIKASEVSPGNSLPYFYQGETLRSQAKYDELINKYNLAIQISPNNYQYLLSLGLSYAGKHDNDNAIKQFQLAQTQKPDQPDPYYYIGKSFADKGNMDDAINYYKQALDVDGKYYQALVGEGQVYVAKGDCVSATPIFTQVLRISPKNQDAANGINICSKKK